MALLILVLAGTATQLYATRWGIGLSPDSASYIGGAIGISEGRGYAFPTGGGPWYPITLWPPLYSILLAIPISLGSDPLAAARFVNAALMGLNVLVVALLLRRVAGPRSLIPIGGAALFLLHRDTIVTHGWAWSEALFMSLALLGLLFLDRYLTDSKKGDLALAAGFTGLAAITRYSGLAFVAIGTIIVFAFPGRPRPSRFKDGLLFVGLACVPLTLWLLRNTLTSGTPTGAGRSPSAVRVDEWQGAYRVVYPWFMPGRIQEPIRSLVMILAGLFLLGALLLLVRATFAKGAAPTAASRMGTIGALTAVGSFMFLLISRTYVRFLQFDDPRHFVPLVPSLLLAFTGTGVLLFQRQGRIENDAGIARGRFRRPILGLLLVYAGLMFVSFFRHTAQWVSQSGSDGMGYSSDSWRSSSIVEAVRSFPKEIPLYSNADDALFLLTGKEVHPLPSRGSDEAPLLSTSLPSDWQEMLELMRLNGGLIAYFDRRTRGGMVDLEDLTAVVTLCPVMDTDEGEIYRLCEAPPLPALPEP